MKKGTIRFYFTFRSPFACIAYYRLRRAPQFKDVNIELIPLWPKVTFGGHMDDPTASIFKMAYIFQDAARQAEVAGLQAQAFHDYNKAIREIVFGGDIQRNLKTKKLGMVPSNETWHIPHTAFLYAEKYGKKGWEFGEAVFSYRFGLNGRDRRDVMTEKTVEEIANSLGLDGKAAARAHASGEFDELQEKHIKMGEEDGCFGFPFFSYMPVDGRAKETYWGNDRLEYILKSILKLDYVPSIPRDTLGSIQQSKL